MEKVHSTVVESCERHDDQSEVLQLINKRNKKMWNSHEWCYTDNFKKKSGIPVIPTKK